MTSEGIKAYIRQTAGGLQQDLLFRRIVVYQQNPLPNNIDIKSAIQKIEASVPRFLCDDIESIFIGQFSFLKEKDMDAVYESGGIYITNEQEDEDDFVSDIIHEIAHSVEEAYPMDVYGDGLIEDEFLAKRQSMAEILLAHGHGKYDTGVFAELDYSVEFDTYLYQEIGYPLLTNLLQGLFISPYGATSLREYFANAFEEFFAGDMYYVKTVSPAVYKKIVDFQTYQ